LEIYDCKKSLSEQAQSAMPALRESVLAADAKKQEVQAKTHVSPPGLHPSLEGWPEATVGQRGQSLWYTGWPMLGVSQSGPATSVLLKVNGEAGVKFLARWMKILATAMRHANQAGLIFWPL